MTTRRWFRFSLRTLFVVMTAGCCWLGYQLNWIRERQQLLDQKALVEGFYLDELRAPGPLWLFGERGYDDLLYVPDWANEGNVTAVSLLAVETPAVPLSAEELARAKALFPESHFRSLFEAYALPNGPCDDYFRPCRGDRPSTAGPRSRLRPLSGRWQVSSHSQDRYDTRGRDGPTRQGGGAVGGGQIAVVLWGKITAAGYAVWSYAQFSPAAPTAFLAPHAAARADVCSHNESPFAQVATSAAPRSLRIGGRDPHRPGDDRPRGGRARRRRHRQLRRGYHCLWSVCSPVASRAGDGHPESIPRTGNSARRALANMLPVASKHESA